MVQLVILSVEAETDIKPLQTKKEVNIRAASEAAGEGGV